MTAFHRVSCSVRGCLKRSVSVWYAPDLGCATLTLIFPSDHALRLPAFDHIGPWPSPLLCRSRPCVLEVTKWLDYGQRARLEQDQPLITFFIDSFEGLQARLCYHDPVEGRTSGRKKSVSTGLIVTQADYHDLRVASRANAWTRHQGDRGSQIRGPTDGPLFRTIGLLLVQSSRESVLQFLGSDGQGLQAAVCI